MNIILPEVVSYIRNERDRCERERIPYPLHKYIHHGLSSQAHVFNLIGPLVVRNDLDPLRQVLTAREVRWPESAHVGFEFEDRTVFNEASGQPTSVDVVVRDQHGTPTIFIEHKLVEPEFGSCGIYNGGDCDALSPARDHGRCYLHHIGRKYWERMDEFGFSEMLHDSQPCPLAPHYQFFREVLLALVKGGTFVLLSDERSPVFHTAPSDDRWPRRGLFPYLLSLVPARHRAQVVSVSIRELVDAVAASKRHDDWLETYRQKYARPTAQP